MDETERIKQILREELSHWNSAQLHDALRFCEEKASETGNVYWMELERTLRNEIASREAADAE